MSFAMRIILVLLIIAAVEGYFLIRFTNSLKIIFPKLKEKKKKLRKVIFGFTGFFNIFLLLALLFWLYILITGDRSIEEPHNWALDYVFKFPFWGFVFLVFQSIVYFLIIDLLRLLLLPLYRKSRPKIKRLQAGLVIIIVTFFIIYIPARIVYDWNTVDVNEYELVKEVLPDVLDDFKVVFISDMQADRFTERDRLNRYISKANLQEPDLIFVGGDFITDTPNYIDTAAVYAGRLQSKYGIYSCVGDHDQWAYGRQIEKSRKEVTEKLEAKGIKMLHNDTLSIKVGSANIFATFITNTYSVKTSEKLIDSLSAYGENSALRVFLVHQPNEMMMNNAVDNDFDLFLAGHTHGGQVSFLFPFIRLSPTLMETKYVRGEFNHDGVKMIINPGLGKSIVPLRYNSTPAVSVITLKKQKEE